MSEKTKFWIAIGLVIAFVIAIIVLHLVQPTISYALCELFCFGSFIAGAFAGWFLKGHIEITTDELNSKN